MLGAGAIGSYVGAALARGGTDVSLIARGAHLAALREHGVTVLSPRGDFSARPPATDDPAEIGPVDVVFLGLKAYSYADCGPLLAPLLHDTTSVVAAQNGVPWWYFHAPRRAVRRPPHRGGRPRWRDDRGDRPGARDRVRRLLLRRARGARRDPPRRGHALLARGARPQRVRALCAAVRGIHERRAQGARGADLRDEIWVKLLGNAIFNPLSVLTRATLAAMCRHPGTRALAREGMQECLAIASALGARPEIDVERRIDGAERVGEHRTSTLQDLEAGKRLELDALVVAVVELAELTGIPAPTLRALAAESTLLAASLGL